MRPSGLLLFALLVHFVLPGLSRSQSIILRNLELIEPAVIDQMNIDGVWLKGGRSFSWDEILQGNDLGDHQAALDEWRTTTGTTRFRILQRLSHRDFASLKPLADELVSQADAAGTRGDTWYLSRCALIRALLFQKEREEALLPLIELIRQRVAHGANVQVEAKAGLRFTDDGFCKELLPVWHDPLEARRVLSLIQQRGDLAAIEEVPSLNVYLESLAIAAGEEFPDPASPDDVNRDPWQSIYLAQSALSEGKDPAPAAGLDPDLHSDSAVRHALALYYSGLGMMRVAESGDVKATDLSRDWQLRLLAVPARYEAEFAELAAAAIHAVLQDPSSLSSREREVLRAELAERYQETTFGIASW